MSRQVGTMLGFAFVVATLVVRVAGAAPPEETPKSKLDTLEKQRTDLQKQEQSIADRLKAIEQEVAEIQKQQQELKQKLAALRQQEQNAREAVEKAKEKDHVIKVEVKGRLLRGSPYMMGYPIYPTPSVGSQETWSLTAKGLSCELDFGGNKAFLETAKKLEGKTIVVTGTLSGRPNPYGWAYPSTIYEPPHKQAPNPMTGFHNPYPYGYGYYGVPTLVLTVTSIKADE